MSLPLKHPLAVLAAAVTGAALVIHAYQAITTSAYVDFVTGVWLALADDFSRGVFYRALIGPDGYGGTRYFPLFFASIGALMRLGAGPLAAGFAVSLASAALLVLGVRHFLVRIGLPGSLAAAFALFVVAPRFSQQALFEIRSDFLAAGLAVWGLAFTLPAFEEERSRTRPFAIAALFFVLAAATKVTSLYAPAAAILALALAARPMASVRLGAMVAAGTAIMVGLVAAASGGRAIESWRACAMAGGGVANWLRNLPPAFVSQVIGPSHAFTSVLLAATAAWLIMARANAPKLALVLFPAALGATTVVLASPGTSYTNQLVDILVVCVVLIGWVLARHPRWQSFAAALLLVLSLAAARQSLQPVTDRALGQRARRVDAERSELVRSLASGGGTVLSESPELLVLAGRRPYMIDPFALRVVTLRRPDVGLDVARKLDERYFSSVVLMYDPESNSGRGWYTNMDLGWPIVSRILANYELDRVTAGLRVYRSKAAVPAREGLSRP
jgi:hypothetical protein